MFDKRIQGQRGAILPLVGLVLVVLLGFGGLVIDLGGLFVAKTELQSALDSCALAAAHELDGAADALTRATNAGLTAGNLNKVKYQESAAGITAGEITFSDTLTGTYSSAFAPAASARYARCTHTTAGIAAYLSQVLDLPASNSVGAVAIATRTHAQSSCPIPIGLLPKSGGTAPNYGFAVGDWVTMLYDGGSPSPGEMGWYNLDGSKNATETKEEMAGTGYCGSKVGDTLGTPGAKVAVTDEWNARFGIYKNHADINATRPDYTGYAYTANNWPAQHNAYAGTCQPGGLCDSDTFPTSANFKTKRQSHASYDDTGTSVKDGDDITGLNMKGGYKTLATPGAGGEHETLGLNRRIVLVPVVAASKIADFACMLMLQPISGPTTSVQLEYLGNAGDTGSPCTSNGLAGGSAGPLVPALVR